MPDQVTIKFGPAKLNTPKAIRNSIADTAVQTQADTIAEVINNTSITTVNATGSSVGQLALVDSYTSSTNIGIATYVDNAGTPVTVEFLNGVGYYLNVGDEIVLLADTAEEYVAVATVDRTPTLPPSMPISTIPTGFPINLSGATYKPITYAYGPAYKSLKYDKYGNFCTYADSYLSRDYIATPINFALNSFTRSIPASFQILDIKAAGIRTIITVDGKALDFNYPDLYYQLNSSSPWIKYDIPSSLGYAGVIYDISYDESNGYLWILIKLNVNPDINRLYYVAPNGLMNLVLTQTYTDNTSIYPYNYTYLYNMNTDNGKLSITQYNVDSILGTTIHTYTKNSNDASQTALFSTSSFNTGTTYYSLNYYGVTKLGEPIQVVNNSSTGFCEIHKITSGGIVSFNTGFSTNDMYISSVKATDSGFIACTFTAKASLFGLGTGTEWISGCFYTNLSSITFPFIDTSMMTAPGGSYSSTGTSNIIQTDPGTIAWLGVRNAYGTTPLASVLYQLAGL